MWQVAHVGQDDEAGPVDPFRELGSDRRRIDQVKLADNDQARRSDLTHSGARVMPDAGFRLTCKGFCVLRPGVPLGEVDEPVDLRGLAIKRRGNQPRQNHTGELADLELTSEENPRFNQRLPPWVGATVGRNQDQALDAFWMSQGKFLRDEAAQRVAGHVRGSRADRFDQRANIVSHVGRRVCLATSIALPRVTKVEGECSVTRFKIVLCAGKRPMVTA
jgi:hypothetical protein